MGPDHIPRPDYADHPEGYPISEQKLKGNTYVKQLDDEEIESLRVACKLGREVLDEGPLQDGDIVNVDVTVYHRGYHGDLNETFFVGKPKETAKKLVINTWECLEKAMEMVKPGVKF